MKGITWGETMIDTDKYEGHIQGEWRDTIHEGAKAHHINAEDVKICTVFPNEATANLVTDAPLLLAEVRRLRESDERWQTHWEFIRDWLANVGDGHISGNDVSSVMDALRPRGEEE